MKVVALLALSALPGLAPQDPGPAPAAPEGRERPAIYDRTPAELPRSDPGRWTGLFDAGGGLDPERFGALDPGLVAEQQRAEQAYAQGNYPGALEILYAVLEREPDFPPGLLVLGTTYFRLRRYGDSAEAYARLLEVAPELIWRTQAYGHCLYSLGEYDAARAHYEALLAAMPEEVGDSVEALRGLALCHMRLGEPTRALELLDHVLALRPDHPEALTWRARILYQEDELEAALGAALAARELDPWAPQSWYIAMRILYDLGRDDEAAEAEARWKDLDRVAQEVRSLEMRLRYEPRQYGLALRLVQLHVSVENVPAVREALAQVVLSRPDEVPELDVRAFVLDTLMDLGDQEGALVAAQALEQTCAEDPAAWKKLEIFYGRLRDRHNQVRCGEMYLRLGGQPPR